MRFFLSLTISAGLVSTAAAVEAPQAPTPPVTAAPSTGSTGETLFTGPQIKAMGGVFPKLLSAPKKPDVKALHEKGIQGEMLYAGYVGADGRMHDVTIKVSSRSTELDAVGRAIVESSTFTPATDGAGKTIAAIVNFPVYLWKDSMLDANFYKKLCRDFVVDADWYAKTFPEKKPDEFRGWLLALGAATTRDIGAIGGVSALKSGTKLPARPDFAAVHAACVAKPDRLLFDAML